MSKASQYNGGIVEAIEATILSGQTKSAAIYTYGVTAVALEMPAAFTGSILTFETSTDGTTFQPAFNIKGIQVSFVCAAARNILIAAQDFFSVGYIKIVSGSAEAADRTIRIIPKSI